MRAFRTMGDRRMKRSSFSECSDYLSFRGSVALKKVPADPGHPEKVKRFFKYWIVVSLSVTR